MPPVEYLLRYSDGATTFKQFDTEQEAQWFIHNEGDHLLEASLVWKSFRFHYRNGFKVLRTFKNEIAAYDAAYKDKEVVKIEKL